MSPSSQEIPELQIVGGRESRHSSYTLPRAFAVGQKFMDKMDLGSYLMSLFSYIYH